MADSNTPTKMGSKLDGLPKEELIKYIKKQVSQMKDLKKKNEDLNTMLKHEKKEVEKFTQEQKAWLSRGVTAEFEKKEKLEKKERELQIAAQLGQQMLLENDELRQKCQDLEKKFDSVEQQFTEDIVQLNTEKETMEKTLVMIQDEYKAAKKEAQKMKEALETAAADQDREHLQWEEERKELCNKVKDLEDEVSCLKGNKDKDQNEQLGEQNQVLREEINNLQLQINSFKEKENQFENLETTTRENNDLKNKIDSDAAELKELNDSLKCLQENCISLKGKNEELNSIVDMLSVERDGSNSFAEQLVGDLSKTKEEKEKVAKSLKIVRGKLEKASSVEEELKQHLNAISTEKNEMQLIVKNIQREKKTLIQSNKKLKERLKGTVNRQPSEESGKDQAVENAELKKEINDIRLKLKEHEEDKEMFSCKEQEMIKEIDANKHNLENLQEKLKETEDNLQKTTSENEDDKALVLKLQARVDELLSTLQSLNEEKMHQESEIEELFKMQDELQSKYDNECRERKLTESALLELRDKFDQQKEEIIGKKSSGHMVDSNVDASNWDTTWTNGDATWTNGDAARPSEDAAWTSEGIAEVKNTKIDNEYEREEVESLRMQLQKLEEELDLERQEKKVIESNFREKVSSVDEFEENEKKILLEHEGNKNEIDRLRAELEKSRNEQGKENEKAFVKLQDLAAENDDLKESLKLNKELVENLEREKEELEVGLKERNNELQDHQNIIESFQIKVQELSEKILIAEDEKLLISDGLHKLGLDLQEKEKSNVLLQENINTLNIELSNIRDLKNEILILQKTCVELEKQREIDVKVVDEYKTLLEDKERQLAEMAEVNCDLKSKVDNYEFEIDGMSKKLESSERIANQISEASDHAISSESKVAKQEEIITDLKMKLTEYEEIECTKAEVCEVNERLKQEILQLKDWINEQSDLHARLQNEAEENSAKLEKLRLSCDEEQQKNVSANELLGRLEEEKRELSALLASSREELKPLGFGVEEFKMKLLEEETKSSKLLEEIEILSLEKSKLSDSLSEAMVFFKELETQVRGSEELVSHLNEELTAKKLVVEEKSQVVMEKESEVDQLRTDINEMKMSLASMSDNVEMQKQVICSLECQIVELEQKDENSIKTMDSMKSALQREQDDNSELRSECEKLSAEKKEMTERQEDSRVQISILENNQKELKDLLEAQISENEILTQSKIQADIERNSLKKEYLEVQRSDNELKEIKELLESSKDDCLKKDNKLLEYENVMAEKNAILDGFQAELFEMRRTLENQAFGSESNEKQISSLEDELKHAQQQIDKLESDGKGKQEKINKLKSMTIKAKKEVDTVKGKAQTEKMQLENVIENLEKELEFCKISFEDEKKDKQKSEEKIKELQEESEMLNKELQKKEEIVRRAEQEIQQLTAVVDKLQLSLASQENRARDFENISKEKQQKIDNLTKQMIEANSKIAHLEGDILEQKHANEDSQEKLLKVTEDYEATRKDVHQMKMMTLEMQDCHRTVESLQSKLSEKEIENKEFQSKISSLQDEINAKHENITNLAENNASSNEEISRITLLCTQQNDELVKLNEEKSEMETKTAQLKDRIEELVQVSEDRTLHISDLAAEKEKLIQQLRNEKELNERNSQCLETKISRMQTEVTLLQEAYDNCKQDFENYKIRAQNVLKQQKLKKNQLDDSQVHEEKSKLEQLVTQLRDGLKEKTDYLATISIEHEDLESEHDKLNQRYNDVMKEMAEKDMQWRNRFAELQTETKKQLLESDDKVKALIAEKEIMEEKLKNAEEFESMKKKYEETLEDLKEQLNNERKLLRRQNSKTKKQVAESESKEIVAKSSSPENLKIYHQTSTDFSTGLVERPGAEGMDSSELEAIDRPSQPTTPASTGSANILEKLLSPTEQSFSWPSSPTFSQEEGRKLRSALTTTEKNIEHLSELLAESEGSNLLLAEQVKVLKSEIRRTQQNQEREEALHNLEYLKNVIIKFIKCSPAEKECMVPVLSTMLKLDAEEKAFITEYAQGGPDSADGSATWSSYVYKWTSFS